MPNYIRKTMQIVAQIKYWHLVLFLFFAFTLMGQEPTYIHFEPEVDLPFSTTYGEIIQDSLGYIWFGTDSGLYRYDGEVFERIPMSSHIRDIEVFDLKKDHNGTLWFLSLTGDLCYLANAEDSARVFNPRHLMDTCAVSRFNIHKNRIFFQIKNSNKSYNLRSFSHHHDHINKIKLEYPAGGRFNFAFDKRQHLVVSYWFHSNGLMDFLSIGPNNQIDSFSLKFNNNSNIDFISDDDDLYMLVNTLKNGKIYVPHNGRYLQKKIFRTPTAINNWYSKDNHLWLLTNNGCYLYDKTKQEVGSISLKGTDIFSMLIDREGGYWFGSNGKGLFYIPPNSLYNYQNEALSNQDVQKIQKIQEGPYVIASQNQILFLDPNTLNPLSEKIILDDVVSDIYIQGLRLFIATTSSLSEYNFDIKNNTVSFIKARKVISKKIIPLKNGDFLTGGSGFLKYYTGSALQNILTERVTALYKDTLSSTIWVGGLQKTFFLRYPPKEDRLSPATPFKGINDYVTMILPDKNNSVWFSTTSSGLIKYNKGNKETRKYPFNIEGKPRKIDQLSCNNPTKVWLSSFNNLYYFDIDKELFYKQPSIKNIIQAPIISLWDTKDTILIGTKKGLFIYFANHINTQRHPPLVNLESIRINFNDTLIQSSYDLSYLQNNIELKFNTIGAFNPLNKAKIYYKINARDNWHLAPNKKIILTNLAPSTYQIIVKSVYQENQAEFNTSIIHFEIHKPFWKTTWFSLLAVFSGSSLIFLWFNNKKKKFEIEKTRKQESEKLKNAILQLQMNPHFIFNSMNTIIYYIT
ncbi:MAG TPA: histidine kinase, partial [Bacteroidetes bacterium]|nr:histidine kinase [Bacteroidota bacterium]